jgi:hypothetical protein
VINACAVRFVTTPPARPEFGAKANVAKRIAAASRTGVLPLTRDKK